MTASTRRLLVRMRNRFNLGFSIGLVLLGAALLMWAVPRARAAEHPGMTADHGPGWRVQECRPGQVCRWRGRVFDNTTGCGTDLWGVANAAPAGTRTACLKVDSSHKVNDR